MSISFYFHSEERCEVTISGKGNEFWDDLELFKRTVNPRDREWDEEEEVWWLFNPRRYTNSFDNCRKAWNSFRSQARLPGF